MSFPDFGCRLNKSLINDTSTNSSNVQTEKKSEIDLEAWFGTFKQVTTSKYGKESL